MHRRGLFQKLGVIFSLLLMCAIYFALHQNVMYAEPPEGDESSSRQPDIFARVLTESLDKAGLGEWVTGPLGVPSPFDTGVRAEYVPTVGVIVRVRVSFPILGPKEGEAPEEASVPPKDLWEKYANSEPDHSILKERTFEMEKGGIDSVNGKLGIPDPDDLPKEKVSGYWKLDGPPSLALKTLRGGSYKWDDGSGNGTEIRSGIQPEYDPKRVSALHDALLDTIAAYGHRLSCLQEGERLLVIVEAPLTDNIRHRIALRSKSGSISGDDFAQLGQLSLVRPRMIAVGGPKDRKLLSVPKTAIVAATTRDALAGQVTEKNF